MLCYKKKKESYTEPLTEQQFYRLLRSKQWNRNIDLYRETGKDSYKTSLPAICFQATFDKSKRAIKDKKTKKVIGYEEGCWNLPMGPATSCGKKLMNAKNANGSRVGLICLR